MPTLVMIPTGISKARARSAIDAWCERRGMTQAGANATFSASHACDTYTALNYAMDLTPLMDKTIDIADYIASYIDRFKAQVKETIGRFLE